MSLLRTCNQTTELGCREMSRIRLPLVMQTYKAI